MEPAVDKEGTPITIEIDTRDGKLFAKVWLMHVGRVDLYLLDCAFYKRYNQENDMLYMQITNTRLL